MKMFNKFMVLSFSVVVCAGSALHADEKDYMTLLNVPVVTEKLSDARSADILRKKCDGVSARLLYAYSEAQKLKKHVVSLGYSKDDVDLFLKSKDAKKVIYSKADKKLESLGLAENGACDLASQQIQNKTYIGSFLRQP